MIAADPAERFGSYEELIGELQRAYNAVTGTGRKSALPKILAALALLAVLGAGGFYFFQRRPVEQPATVPQNVAVPGSVINQKAKQQKRLAQEHERQLAEQKKVADAAREQERQKIHAQELPSWNAAFANYEQKVAAYDFAGALAAISAPQFTDAELKQTQQFATKKAQWLLAWKKTLIADVNAGNYKGTVEDSANKYYLVGASEMRMKLKNPDVATEWEWNRFTPPRLLNISTALIRPGAPDTADREWLSAVFASETRQPESARALGEAAAKIKPLYSEQLGQLLPQTTTR